MDKPVNKKPKLKKQEILPKRVGGIYEKIYEYENIKTAIKAVCSSPNATKSKRNEKTNQGSKGIAVGSTVTIKDGAVYGGLSSARGKTVPAAQRGGKKHTVDKIQVNNGVQEARLKDITSWVAVSSLQAV